MPNRVIKDSIRTSRSINGLTDFQFRLWVHLILSADDYGRGFADPELVKNLAFPRRKRVTESDIGKALSELAGMGCISLYEVDGESYFCFPRWSDHQRVQTKVSMFPEPPKVTEIHRESPSLTVSHRESPLEARSEKRETRSENTPLTPLEGAMAEFRAHRKMLRKPMGAKAEELIRRELEKLAPSDEAKQVAILERSIANGWQGVFDLKSDSKKPRKGTGSDAKYAQRPFDRKDLDGVLMDFGGADDLPRD